MSDAKIKVDETFAVEFEDSAISIKQEIKSEPLYFSTDEESLNSQINDVNLKLHQIREENAKLKSFFQNLKCKKCKDEKAKVDNSSTILDSISIKQENLDLQSQLNETTLKLLDEQWENAELKNSFKKPNCKTCQDAYLFKIFNLKTSEVPLTDVTKSKEYQRLQSTQRPRRTKKWLRAHAQKYFASLP